MRTTKKNHADAMNVARFRDGTAFRYDEESRLCEFYEAEGRGGEGSEAHFLFRTPRGAFVSVTRKYRGGVAPVEAVAERLTEARAMRWALSWSFEPGMADLVWNRAKAGFRTKAGNS